MVVLINQLGRCAARPAPEKVGMPDGVDVRVVK